MRPSSTGNRCKALLRRTLEKHAWGYRFLLQREGHSFHPCTVPVAGMNTTLKSKQDWLDAVGTVQRAGLCPHGDSQKTWDHLAALSFILEHTDKTARILDAGGEIYSPLVKWLFLYGYRSLCKLP